MKRETKFVESVDSVLIIFSDGLFKYFIGLQK